MRGCRARIWFVVGCFLCLVTPLVAQPVTPSDQRLVLGNGLTVLMHSNPSALTLAVCCFCKVSARVETRDTAGLRSLTQQVLLDSLDADGRSLRDRMTDLGLEGTVQLSPDFVEIMLVGTSDQLSDALGLVREILNKPRVAGPAFRLRRNQAVQRLGERRASVDLVAADRVTEYLYQGTSCAWPTDGAGTISTVNAAQVQALQELRYAPGNAVVAISGNLTWEQSQAETRRLLESVLPRPVPSEPALAPLPKAPSAYLYTPWEGETSVVLAAARSSVPTSAAFSADALAISVLGLGQGSRLFLSLRRDRGLVYQVSADFVPSMLCPTVAVMSVCDPKDAREVLRITQAEVARLRTVPPTDDEIDRARLALRNRLTMGHQRNGEVAHYLGMFEMLFGPGSDGGLLSQLDSLTARQVAQAARGLADRLVWVQVGGQRAQ